MPATRGSNSIARTPRFSALLWRTGRMNTTDAALHAELGDIWRDVDRDASVNAVILTGAGKVFSAGGDFAIIQENIDDFASRARQWKEARDIVYNVINCSKPVVSAMRGVAVGAGPFAACSPMYRSQPRTAASSTAIRGSVWPRATTPQSSGRCFVASP